MLLSAYIQKQINARTKNEKRVKKSLRKAVTKANNRFGPGKKSKFVTCKGNRVLTQQKVGGSIKNRRINNVASHMNS
jgi:hypothetical protein